MVLIRLPEEMDFEEEMKFLEGRCSAITWKRKRCANPVFYSQWYVGVGYDDNVVEASEEDYDRWITGLCPMHYNKLLAEENAETDTERNIHA